MDHLDEDHTVDSTDKKAKIPQRKQNEETAGNRADNLSWDFNGKLGERPSKYECEIRRKIGRDFLAGRVACSALPRAWRSATIRSARRRPYPEDERPRDE
eukprot:1115941-Pleurochrysis_carterae.AAC.2